jgi:heme exporter protein CcmB
MLSLGRLFANDHMDGTLEQMLLTPQPLYLIVVGKVLAQWLVSEIPLVLIAPVVGVQFGLSQNTLLVLAASLLIGTPVLSLIGAIGAGLTLGLRGSGVLISLLVLPLYIPVLVFGAGAVEATITGTSPIPHLELQGAALVLTLVFAPWATAANPPIRTNSTCASTSLRVSSLRFCMGLRQGCPQHIGQAQCIVIGQHPLPYGFGKALLEQRAIYSVLRRCAFGVRGAGATAFPCRLI